MEKQCRCRANQSITAIVGQRKVVDLVKDLCHPGFLDPKQDLPRKQDLARKQDQRAEIR